jgi:hypothetical protein
VLRSVLVAIAAFVGAALAYKLVFAAPNPGFDPHPHPDHDTDPDQQKLVELLIARATGTDVHAIGDFVRKKNWGGNRLRNRLRHARSRIRLTAEPAVTQRVEQVVRHMIWRSLIWDVPYYDDPDNQSGRP